MDQYSGKEHLLNAIRTAHDELDMVIASLDEREMVEPAGDALSPKVALAHMTAWERRLVRWLEEATRGEAPERPDPGATWDGIDRINDRDFATNRLRPLADVLRERRDSFSYVLRAVSGLSEDDLTDDQRFGWPTWQMIRSNTDQHYREHAAVIYEITASRGSPAT